MERFRHIVISLLLLAYMGQSLAAVAMPCFNVGSAPGDMGGAMAGMDHHTAPVEQSAAGDESCCESGGFCSMSQCQAVVALTVATLPGMAVYAAIHNDAPLFSQLNVSSASLYRPPISR